MYRASAVLWQISSMWKKTTRSPLRQHLAEASELAANGRSWKIMRGVEVKVPRCVAEVLENAQMMAEEARRYVDERAS